MKNFVINGQHISLKEIEVIINSDMRIELGKNAKNAIIDCRNYLENKIAIQKNYYGINTGFGALCNTAISNEDLAKLQRNLVYHACGMGKFIPKNCSIDDALKIISLSHGHSTSKRNSRSSCFSLQ